MSRVLSERRPAFGHTRGVGSRSRARSERAAFSRSDRDAACTKRSRRSAWALLLVAGCTCGAREAEPSEPVASPTPSVETPVTPEAPPAPRRDKEREKVEAELAGEPEAQQATLALADECDTGLTTSCVALAAAWEAGEGVRASEGKARRLYRAACRRAGEGCLDAARLHGDQAGPYYARGCEAGLAEACRRWAQARPDEAAQAREKGCALGWIEACDQPVEGCGGPLSRCLERARAFVLSSLGPLAQTGPRSAELRETLATYIDSGGSISDTAQRLHLHRNSVKYRLNQLEEAIGPDYNATRVRAAIELVDRVPQSLREASNSEEAAG